MEEELGRYAAEPVKKTLSRDVAESGFGAASVVSAVMSRRPAGRPALSEGGGEDVRRRGAAAAGLPGDGVAGGEGLQ